MRNFDIIDVHAHVYPEKIAVKASESVSKFYGIEMAFYDATVQNLEKEEDGFGVKKIIIHSVATAPTQVVSINNFIAGLAAQNNLFHPFATLHPDMEKSEILDEIARVKELGLKGIKMHPDCQKFCIAGERGRKIFDCLSGDLPVQLHTGDKRYSYSNPKLMVEVAKDYPHINFIAAHFGGYSEWEKVGVYKGLENVYFDTSSSLSFLSSEQAAEIIKELGVEKFMFATDYPMWSLKGELELFLKIPLADDERRLILADNARRILNIKE